MGLNLSYADVAALENRTEGWVAGLQMAALSMRGRDDVHASASGDVERTARLVEEHSFAVMDRRELTTVVGWLDALPDDVIRSRPWLSVSYAWALMYTGQMDGVEPRLRDAEKASDGKERSVKGYIAATVRPTIGERGIKSPTPKGRLICR